MPMPRQQNETAATDRLPRDDDRATAHGPAHARALGDELVRIHDHLRQELADLVADVDDFLAGQPAGGRSAAEGGSAAEGADRADAARAGRTPPGFRAQLRERCLSACGALHAHHDNENDRGFPLLEKRFPELAPTIELLRHEHVALMELRVRLEETVAGLGSGDDPGRMRAELRELVAQMEAHFDREERQLISALNSL